MGGDIKGPALHRDGQALDALIAVGDGKFSSPDGHRIIGVDGVIPA